MIGIHDLGRAEAVAYVTQQQMTDRFGAAMLIALTDRAAVATGLIDAALVTKA